MDFLARREHSFYELQQKLAKKFPDAPTERIDQVLETLKGENLQSDERFVESYVRYRKSRGFGSLHIRSDLSSRRVSDTLIESYLVADGSEDEMVQSLIRKKCRDEQGFIYGSKTHRKLVNFLQSRGFTLEQIHNGLASWIISS